MDGEWAVKSYWKENRAVREKRKNSIKVGR
jgi:hypothetical protein